MRIGILGCMGRMGQALMQEVECQHQTLSAGSVRPGAPLPSLSIPVFDTPQPVFSHSDVVIDCTLPQAFDQHLQTACQERKALIIGTTGISDQQKDAIQEASQFIPLLYAACLAPGVNVLLYLVQKAATLLDDSFDIEIVETHHRYKKDAPSGTALTLAEAAAKARGLSLGSHLQLGPREGERQRGAIGIASLRGGDVIGEHTVYFHGEGESLALTQRSQSRSTYARGAVKAAIWLKDKKPGLYTMKDVLGLHV